MREEYEVFIHDEHIQIQITETQTYKIHLDRCKTHAQILDWVIHLSGKTWGNQQLLKEVAELAASHWGLVLVSA